MLEIIQNFDTSIMLFIQEHIRGSFIDGLMLLFSSVGHAGIIWIITGLALIAVKRYRKTGFLLLLTMGLCFVFNDIIIKNAVMRPRPFLAIEALYPLSPFPPESYSFPSGHSCSSFASACVLTRGFKKRGWMFYILAAFIALSRPYVGVHYPSDILVGAIVGTLGAVLLYAPLSKLYSKLGKFKFFSN